MCDANGGGSSRGRQHDSVRSQKNGEHWRSQVEGAPAGGATKGRAAEQSAKYRTPEMDMEGFRTSRITRADSRSACLGDVAGGCSGGGGGAGDGQQAWRASGSWARAARWPGCRLAGWAVGLALFFCPSLRPCL